MENCHSDCALVLCQPLVCSCSASRARGRPSGYTRTVVRQVLTSDRAVRVRVLVTRQGGNHIKTSRSDRRDTKTSGNCRPKSANAEFAGNIIRSDKGRVSDGNNDSFLKSTHSEP
eukprot:scaffold58083_cov33-Prasinocladus_malaysianus.AAC.1